ncbi:MAG: hypothetical protein COU81_01230 [Candidatus Portnoybacteria bacterium CG10_big_fil_rev_8_21_14_0_10_36_7]|uniref:Uncharacterized protein n=1 Tax=Candidatus Portnoybacteria bacterium CG10_big_fil_rev_8_21_14_0_10_36_7 TaxID=1974812 RepID=A0A2M8KEL2_9BACT|nr:MAG: hypothetical protein COU81_01230 [Candidatus Portnoybacteria bacterium CG10_big_fil_rev_8_21_14_0_10_36_7]
MLDLDFGFNEYPNGELDDTKVVEYSPLRFLSKKNHDDDFVVNQEDGIHWWLYSNARSNYLWKPSRQVTLKSSICP